MNTLEIKTSVKVIGANGQISLGKEFAGRQVLVEEREPGVWMVRTALVIPENEMWLHQPQMSQDLKRALAYAQSNPPQAVDDLDAFLGKIDNEKQESTTGLNNPVFQESWLRLDKNERNRVTDTLKKLKQLTWDQVYRDQGLKWEKIVSIKPPVSIETIYSLRITQSQRAVAHREGEIIRFLIIEPDHDATYGKK